MSDVKGMVDSAVTALKAGKKSEARTTLTQAVDLDPQNEQAWLYLSALVPSLEEQEICLENVLTINPSNERAKKALNIVLEKQGKPPRSAAPATAPPPAPAAPPASPASTDSGWESVNSGSGWDEIEVANWDELVSDATPADSPEPPPTSPPPSMTTAPADTGNADWLASIDTNPWQTDDNDPVVSGGWDLASDPIPSSVDWEDDSPVAAHGSGQNVEQPSNEQYDSWISGMNLGGSSGSPPTPEPEPATDVSDFGSVDATPSPASTGTEDVYDTSNWSDGWTTPGVDSETDNFFDSTPADSGDNPFADVSSIDLTSSPESERSAFGGFLQSDEPPSDDDLSDFSFNFDEEDSTYTKAVDVDEDFLTLDFIDEIEDATGARRMNLNQYFAEIPNEIDVKIKTSGGGKLGIIVLLLMNIAAAVGLVIQAG